MQEEYRYLPHTCSCSVNPWNPKTTYQDITKCIKGIFQPWFSDISYNVQILLENKTEKCQMSNIWKGILRPSPSVCWRMHKLKLERSCIKHIFPLEAGKTNNDQMSNMLKNIEELEVMSLWTSFERYWLSAAMKVPFYCISFGRKWWVDIFEPVSVFNNHLAWDPVGWLRNIILAFSLALKNAKVERSCIKHIFSGEGLAHILLHGILHISKKK